MGKLICAGNDVWDTQAVNSDSHLHRPLHSNPSKEIICGKPAPAIQACVPYESILPDTEFYSVSSKTISIYHM